MSRQSAVLDEATRIAILNEITQNFNKINDHQPLAPGRVRPTLADQSPHWRAMTNEELVGLRHDLRVIIINHDVQMKHEINRGPYDVLGWIDGWPVMDHGSGEIAMPIYNETAEWCDDLMRRVDRAAREFGFATMIFNRQDEETGHNFAHTVFLSKTADTPPSVLDGDYYELSLKRTCELLLPAFDVRARRWSGPSMVADLMAASSLSVTRAGKHLAIRPIRTRLRR